MKNALELDTVGLHVLHNALTNIAAEMALVMMKTSYSTIFNEGLDFSTVLLDADGNLIAEKTNASSMMRATRTPCGRSRVRPRVLRARRRRRPQRPFRNCQLPEP